MKIPLPHIFENIIQSFYFSQIFKISFVHKQKHFRLNFIKNKNTRNRRTSIVKEFILFVYRCLFFLLVNPMRPNRSESGPDFNFSTQTVERRPMGVNRPHGSEQGSEYRLWFVFVETNQLDHSGDIDGGKDLEYEQNLKIVRTLQPSNLFGCFKSLRPAIVIFFFVRERIKHESKFNGQNDSWCICRLGSTYVLLSVKVLLDNLLLHSVGKQG